MSDETTEQARSRYLAAAHAMQSGVAAKMADAMEREKALYESFLREHFGHDGVNLA